MALRPVRFRFANGETKCHRGWTDDTYWNGFLNVKTTPKIIPSMVRIAKEAGEDPVVARSELNGMVRTITIDGRKRRVIDLSGGYVTEECPKRRGR